MTAKYSSVIRHNTQTNSSRMPRSSILVFCPGLRAVSPSLNWCHELWLSWLMQSVLFLASCSWRLNAFEHSGYISRVVLCFFCRWDPPFTPLAWNLCLALKCCHRSLTGKYDPDLNCVWTITVEPNNVIEISFTLFKLENRSSDGACRYDYVQVSWNAMVAMRRCCLWRRRHVFFYNE